MALPGVGVGVGTVLRTRGVEVVSTIRARWCEGRGEGMVMRLDWGLECEWAGG